MTNIRIGIDFDNTLVGYDEVFLAEARNRGLVPRDFAGTKKEIRDAIRLLQDGELSWQKLQGYVYGRGIGGAAMLAGADRFLRRCRKAGHTVVIVSHKTEYGHHDPERIDLREAARGWLTDHGFFAPEGYGLRPEDVFFEGTREDKLQRIGTLDMSYFVDDLIEVIGHPAFPPSVRGILLSEAPADASEAGFLVCPSWRHVEEVVFDGRA